MDILEFKNILSSLLGLIEIRHRRQDSWTGRIVNRKYPTEAQRK